MIRITAELIPHGNEKKKRLLGQCLVVNDGTGTLDSGNYDIYITNKFKSTFSTKDLPKSVTHYRVTGFNRIRQNVWDLLYKALGQRVTGATG